MHPADADRAGLPLTASMLRDIERAAPVEADHIFGDLLRRAGPVADKSLLHVAYGKQKPIRRGGRPSPAAAP